MADQDSTVSALAVYTGSSPGARPEYTEAARTFGHVLAEAGITLVYGGGDVGLMGVIADAVLEAKGHVVGVITAALVEREVAHRGLDEFVVVDTMHERKRLMAERADAFAAMPGGLGTLEELFEALTWTQLGVHHKPCGLLNVCGYYDRLLEFLDVAAQERFVSKPHRNMLCVESSPAALLQQLLSADGVANDKWLDRA